VPNAERQDSSKIFRIIKIDEEEQKQENITLNNKEPPALGNNRVIDVILNSNRSSYRNSKRSSRP